MSRRANRDGGAVTVEAAVGIGVIVAVFGGILAAVAMLIGQLRCVDAAVEAARLASRGESARAAEAVARLGPNGARLEMAVRGDRVSTSVISPPLGGLLPVPVLEGRANAVMEPGASLEGR